MAEYWRRRPVAEAMQYSGDIEALRAWVTATVDPAFCVILNNVVVEEFEGGFRALWDEGYVGAETMEARGGPNDYLIIESCWFRTLSPLDFNAQFEPAI